MGTLIHYQEYSCRRAKINANMSQLKALVNAITITEITDMNMLELNAVREIIRKLFLKLQRKAFTGKCTSISFNDSELWALSHITRRIPAETYTFMALYPLIEIIEGRAV